MRQIDIYTDGACSGNPGPGGYGYIVTAEGKELTRGYDGFRRTTNNRMEILAVAEGLKAVYESVMRERRDTDIKVTVFSDSQLVVNTLSLGWARKTNLDLWEKVDEALFDFNPGQVTFEKVKGHSDNKYNNLADSLAVYARDVINKKHSYDAIDAVYENISPAGDAPGLFEERPAAAEPEVKEIRILGYGTPGGRKVEVDLTNGTTVTITACHGGFQQTRCTRAESAVTVDIAWRFVAFLNGKPL